MKLTLYQVDAFAENVFTGNPAAVIPLEDWIEDELMQKIAMENNLSETVFLVKGPWPPLTPPTGGENNAHPETSGLLDQDANYRDDSQSGEVSAEDGFPRGGKSDGGLEVSAAGGPSHREGSGMDRSYHIRWFTPEYEIDLCGHATLASAYVIKNFIEPHLQEINFTTEKAGPLKAYAKDGAYTLDFPSRMPQACEVPKDLLKSVGVINAVEVLRSRDYFVVLPDEDAVKNVEPDYTVMKELDTIGVIVTAKGRSADVVSRCFYPGAGIPEDPVTGSAHCNIVPYWAEKLHKHKLHCKQLSLRGGDLQCELVGDRVLMSGKCVLFMQGEINLVAL